MTIIAVAAMIHNKRSSLDSSFSALVWWFYGGKTYLVKHTLGFALGGHRRTLRLRNYLRKWSTICAGGVLKSGTKSASFCSFLLKSGSFLSISLHFPTIFALPVLTLAPMVEQKPYFPPESQHHLPKTHSKYLLKTCIFKNF